MDKQNWLSFLQEKIKSQVSIESFRKAQTWGFALLALVSFGMAVSAIEASDSASALYPTKLFFLVLAHFFVLLGFYLPNLFQKGQNAISRYLGIRDFSSLIMISGLLFFYSIVSLMLSWQIAGEAEGMRMSNFFIFTAWTNAIFSGVYVAAFLLYFSAIAFFPNFLGKFLERLDKASAWFVGLHATFAFLLGFGLAEIAPIGSVSFFDQLRLSGLFWVFVVSSILFVGRLWQESFVPGLFALELEVASGRLERSEDILARVKESFLSRRLSFWVHRISHHISTQAHEIARYTHEAVSLTATEIPTEVDLRQVEDRYKRSDALFHKLEKSSQRFLVANSLYHVSDAERERLEALKDQFSRELRNAKIELAGVRKRIDEKLVAIKNRQMLPMSEPAQIPVEKVPFSQ